MASALTRLRNWVQRGLLGITAEGSYRGPFSGLGELGGSYLLGPFEDGWHRNLDISSNARHVPAVYACVMVISRAMSQCYPKHVRHATDQFEEVTTSAAYRVLRYPNSYQTTPDFILNLISQTLFEGEAFALATRNDRYEVDQLHLLPRGTCSPLIDEETKEIFYAVGSSPLAPGGTDYIVPARDILHLRFHTPRHPLIGETPIKSAALAIGINVALSKTQAVFFNNMNRPSGVLSTDVVLNKDQITTLREAFENQAQGLSAGKIPVLGGGLKFQPIGITSQDAQLIEAQRMSLEDICRVFGVPPPLVGELSHSTLNNAETLIANFLSVSLGSYLEHTERAMDRLFGLKNNEYIEFDTTALLRTDFEKRIDGLTKAIQGGLMTPVEARAREGLGTIDGGDTAYLQRQMVPIDKIGDLLQAEIDAKNNPPAPAPVAGGDPKPDNPPADTPKAPAPASDGPAPAKKSDEDFDPEVVRLFLNDSLRNKRAA